MRIANQKILAGVRKSITTIWGLLPDIPESTEKFLIVRELQHAQSLLDLVTPTPRKRKPKQGDMLDGAHQNGD